MMSGIPPAMADTERTDRATRLLARLGLVPAGVGGGVRREGSPARYLSIPAPSPEPCANQQGRSMTGGERMLAPQSWLSL